jgi:uncharacterized membrane protein (DUF485 family)
VSQGPRNSVATDGVDTDPAVIAAQRRQARRAAVLLGIVALCVYVGFIVATGLRN